jgi:AraC-like DNA-binding protein
MQSIAIETGIPDLQHFNKLIRPATGFSPRDYRTAGAKRQAKGFTGALISSKSTGTSKDRRSVR